MRFVVLFMLGLVTPAIAAPDTSPAGAKSFQGWTAICNNLGACVSIGSAQDELFYVRIARDAGAAAAPEVKIVLAAQAPLKGAAPSFRLQAKADEAKSNQAKSDKAEALGPYPAKATDSTQFASVLPGDAGAVFIDKIRNAASLDYALLGAKGTLELKGLSAALRWIDARQGRAGTPTALVAKGMTPVGQVPPPRPAPVLTAAASDGVAEIAKPVLSPAVLRRAKAEKDCDKEAVKAEGAEAWRLGSDLVLVAVPCLQGAYNSSSAFFFTDAKGGAPRAVPLPQEPGHEGPDTTSIATNASFDPKTMTLTDFDKGRGIGDCGTTRTWLWTGRKFELLEAQGLQACPGALPEDWPSIYAAVRK